MTRGELLDVAADVAWRFRAYDSYSRDRTTAIRAIRRKCPDFTQRQLENAFDGAVSLYDYTKQLVAENANVIWDVVNEGSDNWNHLLDDQLKPKFPAFRKSSLHMMVSMNFYYWHMR